MRIESDELDVLTIDELQNNLLVHEQCMKTHVVEEHALKVTLKSLCEKEDEVIVELEEEEETNIALTNPLLNVITTIYKLRHF